MLPCSVINAYLKPTIIALAMGMIACGPSVPPTASQPMSFKVASGPPCYPMKQKLAAIVITGADDLSEWKKRQYAIEHAPKDADGGSAAPISHDGYFLTAAHVLNKAPGKNLYVIYSCNGNIMIDQARVVWSSYSSDLAIVHIPKSTPYYYQWSDIGNGLPAGQTVYHGGMHWRDMFTPEQCVHSIIYGWICNDYISPKGKLRTPILPEWQYPKNQTFKMDIRLQPGDSGGPVVDPHGKLIGINSQVEVFAPMKTPIFVNALANRPSPSKIAKIIDKDRN